MLYQILTPNRIRSLVVITTILAVTACKREAVSTPTPTATSTAPATVKSVAIGVTQIATHPGIDAVREGFLAEMTRQGYTNDGPARYTFTNANGDFAAAQAIAARFAREDYDLIFSISTPSTQTCMQALKGRGTPLVFGAITDPVGAGIVASLERPGGNVTGTADIWPINDQLALLRQLVPQAKRLGVPFNPAEANARSSVASVTEAAPKYGFEVITTPVSSAADVPAATRSLANRVDAMYIPADNTVISAIAAVVSVCEQRRLPLMPGDTSNVEVGGFGTIGHDYKSVGAESAKIAVRVLKGESPASIPVAVSPVRAYFFNLRSAKAMGIAIPEELVAKAAMVYR